MNILMCPSDLIAPFMLQALKLAFEAEKRDEVPVGAVLVENGQIIGRGYNQRESSHRSTAHAEILAIEDYNHRTGQWRLPPDTSLVVTVEPCLMCAGALLAARVSNIYYGCADPKNAGLLRIAPLIEGGIFDHQFKLIQGGVLEAKCSSTIQDYFRRKRKGR